MCHPKPKGPLPAPESYERLNCGPNPERPGLAAIGTVSDPVPVIGLTANFSPMPRIAPPPFGREGDGSGLGFSAFPSSEVAALPRVLLTNVTSSTDKPKLHMGQKLNLPSLERNLNNAEEAFKRQLTKCSARRGMSHNFV